jgi:hypothetical protein
MQLLYSPMSPFARKVRVVAFELGLTDRLELVIASPYTDESVRAINPLSKIPILLPAQDARADLRLAGDLRLSGTPGRPGPDAARRPRSLATLTRQAKADGMGDAALAIVRERLREARTARTCSTARRRTGRRPRPAGARDAAVRPLRDRRDRRRRPAGLSGCSPGDGLARRPSEPVRLVRNRQPPRARWWPRRHTSHNPFDERDHYRGLISFTDKRHWRWWNRSLCSPHGSNAMPARSRIRPEGPPMSAARLFRIVDAVATRLATLTLIVGLPLAAVTFAVKTF